MAITRNVSIIVGAPDGSPAISVQQAISADAVDEREVSITNGADRQVNIAIDVSAMLLLALLSDKALTIETNSGSAADDTLTLAANVPFIWTSTSGVTNPLDTDVTAFFVTNASGVTATLKIVVLQDATP